MKHTGKIHLSEGVREPATEAVNGQEGDGEGMAEFSKSAPALGGKH